MLKYLLIVLKNVSLIKTKYGIIGKSVTAERSF